MSDGDVGAVFATLHHCITSAAKFDVDGPTLSLELQQLGLPRELSDALVRPYSESRQALRDAGLRKTLRLPPLKVVEVLGTTREIAGGDGAAAGAKDGVVCRLGTDGASHLVAMSDAKLDLLISELQQAQTLLQSNIERTM